MARDFAGNQNANINNGISGMDVSAFSMMLVANADTINNFMVIWQTASAVSGGNSAAVIYQAPGSALFAFEYRWTSTKGNWNGSTTVNIGTNYSIVVTYDRGSTANDPRMWINNGEETLNEVSTPSGSAKTGIDSSVMGENVGGGSDYNGRGSEFAFWNRILDPGEALALSNFMSPLFFPRGLITYWPCIRTLDDRIQGADLTNSGSTVAIHPPMMYPSSPHIITAIAAAVGADVRRHIIPAYTQLSV